jgi:hypothetical protein
MTMARLHIEKRLGFESTPQPMTASRMARVAGHDAATEIWSGGNTSVLRRPENSRGDNP